MGRLAHHGKCLRQQLVEGFTFFHAGLEFIRPGAQFGVRELLDGGFECIDGLDFGDILLDQPLVAAAKHFFQQGRNHG